MSESATQSMLSASPAMRPRRYGFWRTIGITIAIFVLSHYLAGISSSFVGAAAIARSMATTGDVDPSTLSFFAEPTSPWWLFAAALQSCLMAVMVYIAIWDAGFSSRAYFETKPFTIRRLVRTTLAFVGIVLLVRIIWVSLRHLLGGAAFSSIDLNITWRDRLSAFPVSGLLVCVFLFPSVEEFFLRGFLFTGIAKSFAGPHVAILLTSCLFAGIHWHYEPAQIALVFLVGLFLGWNRYKTRSLVPPIIFHALFNFFSLLPFALRH